MVAANDHLSAIVLFRAEDAEAADMATEYGIEEDRHIH